MGEDPKRGRGEGRGKSRGETVRLSPAPADSVSQGETYERARGLLALALSDPDGDRMSVALGLAGGDETGGGKVSAGAVHHRYRAGELLGRGGMGEVREVHDAILDREVAMKTAHVDDDQVLSRFVQEARITGKLQHPNIPPVHDLGVGADGQHYFTMRRVRGRELADLIEEDAAGSLMERLDTFRKICDAIAYAHSRGVIHRDLKPSNIMVGEFGTVLVMDWGLAKLVGSDGSSKEEEELISGSGSESHETRYGAIMGTPAWMAPEQARGETHTVGPCSDIYSLGAILYALLTGKPPFEGEAEEVLSHSAAGQIVPPSQRSAESATPRELDSVVLRAMATDPAARFESVEELRAEIQAFIERRPLASAEYTYLQRVAKFVARHRAAVTGATVVGVIAFAFLSVGLWRYMTNVTAARDRAESEAARAGQEAARAVGAERDALIRLGDSHLATADALVREERPGEAEAALTRARALFVQTGRDTLPVDLRLSDLASRFVLPVRRWNAGAVTALAMREDARRVIVATEDGRASVWSLPEARLVSEYDPRRDSASARVVQVGWHQDEARAVILDGETARLVAIEAGAVRAGVAGVASGYRRLHLIGGERILLQYSREGGDFRTWVAGEPGLRRVPFPDQFDVYSFWGRDHAVGPLDVRPLALEIREIDSGRVAWRVEGWRRGVVAADRSAVLLTEMASSELALADGVTGRLRWNAPGNNLEFPYLSADGSRAFAIGGDGQVLAWKTEDGSRVGLLSGRTERRWREVLQVSRDGERVLGVLEGGDLALWRLGGEKRWQGNAPPSPVRSVALSADGGVAVAACTGGEVFLFDTVAARVLATGRVGAGARDLDLSPDGRRVAIAGVDGQIWLWDLVEGSVAPAFRVDPARSSAVSFVLQGRAVAGVGLAGALEIRSVPELRKLHRIERAHEGVIWTVASSPDGNRLVTTGRDEADGHVRVWDARTGKLLHEIGREPIRWVPFGASWSPDGQRVVSGRHSGHLLLWNLEADSARAISAHGGPAMDVAFSPDGRTVASTGYDGVVSFWDAETFAAQASFARHSEPVTTVVFSGDSSTIAHTSGSGHPRVWGVRGYWQQIALGHAIDEDLADERDDGEALARRARLAVSAGYWEDAAILWERARAAGAEVAALDRLRALCMAGRLEQARALLDSIPVDQRAHPGLHGWNLWLSNRNVAKR